MVDKKKRLGQNVNETESGRIVIVEENISGNTLQSGRADRRSDGGKSTKGLGEDEDKKHEPKGVMRANCEGVL